MRSPGVGRCSALPGAADRSGDADASPAPSSPSGGDDDACDASAAPAAPGARACSATSTTTRESHMSEAKKSAVLGGALECVEPSEARRFSPSAGSEKLVGFVVENGPWEWSGTPPFTFKAQGELHEAQPLYEEALATRRAALGDEHPDTLTSINNLASLYRLLPGPSY